MPDPTTPAPGGGAGSAGPAGTGITPETAALLDGLQDMIALVDPETLRFRYVNQAAGEMTGYAREELLALTPLALKPTLDEAAYRARFVEPLVSGSAPSVRLETRHRTRGGREHPVEVLGQRYAPGPGRLLLLNVVRDLTARRQTENALRAAEAQAAAFLEHSHVPTIVIDRGGTIRRFNRAAELLLGYGASEALGRNVSLLMPPPHRARHDGYLARYLETGVARVIGIGRELEALHRDRHRIPVEFAVTEVAIEDGPWFVGTLRDLREQKVAEAAIAERSRLLANSRAQYRTEAAIHELLHRAATPAALLDDTLALLAREHDLQPSAVYLGEHDALELGASHGLQRAPAGDAPSATSLAAQVLRRGEPCRLDGPTASPLRLDTGVGTVELASLLLLPIGFRKTRIGVLVAGSRAPIPEDVERFLERVAAVLGAAITNRRQFRQLQELSEELATQHREVRRQYLALERASRAKSEFLGTMSHELRTPLNSILGFAKILREGAAGPVNERQSDYLGQVCHAGEHLLQLINDVLDLGKGEVGEVILAPEMVDPFTLLSGAVATLSAQAERKGVSLRLEVPRDLPPLRADPQKLRQILFNLLANGIKFTDRGGKVALRARREHPRGGPELVIEVLDDGVGIRAEDLSSIFDPFVQVNAALSRRHEGAGLGLALVKRLVELHAGRVEVESAPGEGSCFTVRLPYAAAPPETRAAPAAPAREAAPSREAEAPREVEAARPGPAASASRVLVVEDDPRAARLFCVVLEGAGLEVDVAGSVAEARRALAERRPALVVLDLLFEEGSGWEVLDAIAALPCTRRPAVVIASVIGEKSRERGIAMGASAVLQKPIDPAGLLACVERLVDGARPGQPHRVLVIDDDPAARELARVRLRAAGYQVALAPGGREGLAQLRAHPPDLLVLDLMMPEVNGFAVLEAMASDSRLAEIPTLVITAKTLAPKERAFLDRTVRVVMEKNGFDAERFLLAVTRTLQASRRDRP